MCVHVIILYRRIRTNVRAVCAHVSAQIQKTRIEEKNTQKKLCYDPFIHGDIIRGELFAEL